MQSSNLKEAKAMRDSYPTEYEREAFSAGYNHAHGIACHNVPKIGETYWLEDIASVTPETAEQAKEIHGLLCFSAEMNARCFSPWEYTAKEINSLDEDSRERAWEAYDAGVEAAIAHDLAGYTSEDYT